MLSGNKRVPGSVISVGPGLAASAEAASAKKSRALQMEIELSRFMPHLFQELVHYVDLVPNRLPLGCTGWHFTEEAVPS